MHKIDITLFDYDEFSIYNLGLHTHKIYLLGKVHKI